MDMDISSDSSSSNEKTQPLEHIGTPMLVCPSQTMCQMRNFDNLKLGAFLSIYAYFNRVLSIYLGNTDCLNVKHTYFSASL